MLLLQLQDSRSFVDHNHEPDEALVSVTKLRATLKQQARETKSRPNQLLAQGLECASDEVRANIGQLDTCRRDLRRQRRGTLPKEPATLRELVITDEWKCTSGEQSRRFLLYDSGSGANNRMVVYATDECLRLMCRARKWFMDGNFAMSPAIFQQLYVIRVPLGETAVSCVYAFLSGKSQIIYEELLQSIVDGCDKLGFTPDPSEIILDFEKSAIQAVSTILGPHVDTKGCFFHLTQSTWRKIQELGLVNCYRDSNDCKLFCGMMDGLAFLPLDKLQEGMSFLKDITPEGFEDLLTYFDRTYVIGTFRHIRLPGNNEDPEALQCNIRRLPPTFPSDIWTQLLTTSKKEHIA